MSDDEVINGRRVVYRLGDDIDGDPRWSPINKSLADFMGLSQSYRTTRSGLLHQTAALICLDVLAQDISKATIRLKKRVRAGANEVEPRQHPVAALLATEPNRRHTWPEFVQMLVYHLAICSNSYAYVRRQKDDTPTAIIPVIPGRTAERVDPSSGDVFYDISASSVHEQALLGAASITAPERDVVHIRNRVLDGFWGTSTVALGASTLEMGEELLDYEKTLFSRNKLDHGYFVRHKEARQANDEAFRRMQDQVRKILTARAGEYVDLPLLEDGIEFKSWTAMADKTDMIRALDKQIEMIGKLWRMPPHKTMSLNAVKYENLATLEMIYVRDTLIPICKLIEARLARTLLSAEERLVYFFEFDRDEMAIADEEVKREWLKVMMDRGAISLNEARVDAGWNRRAGGDVYIVPVNTVLVDSRNRVVVAGGKVASETAEDDADEIDEDGQKSFLPKLITGGRS